MRNILVTGANGFIGQALCKRMLADGYQARGAVRCAAQMTALPSGAEGAMVGNIGPETDWSEALADIDTVVHLAARVHIMDNPVVDPIEAFRKVNVFGTERLARMAAKTGVKRFVFIRSVKVNGEGKTEPYREDDTADPQKMKFPRSFGHREKIVYYTKHTLKGVRNDGETNEKKIHKGF